jgi:intracellular septation protein A
MQPKVENATPEEFEQWQQTELNWWADRQLSIVALMSVVQVVVFGLMLLVFYINSKIF